MELVRLIHDQTSFTLDLYKEVWKQQHQDSEKSDKNAVISPLSIALAMAMAAAGAKGQTMEQINSVVRLPNGPLMHDFSQQLNSLLQIGPSASGPALSFANGVWVEQSLKLRNDYREIVEKSYGAAATPVDFITKANESRELINSWVADKTKKKIEGLLPDGSVSANSRLVLANAIYFKGAWEKKLDPGDTSDGIFHLASGGTVTVPMMRSKIKRHFVQDNGAFKVLRLPYQRGDDPRCFAMYFLLPAEPQGLGDLLRGLHSAESIGNALTGIHEAEVSDLRLPRFKISLGIQAPELLKALGLELPFSPEADFSALAEDPSAARDLVISDVFHRALVEVNEEGSEAAAASAAVIALRSLDLHPPIEFVADRPFVFLVREDATGIILFIGHVNNPAL